MKPCSTSLWGGILYSAPFACWFFAAAVNAQTQAEVEATVDVAFRSLILLQGFAVAVVYPSLQQGSLGKDLAATVAFLAIAWPLFAVFKLAGNMAFGLLVLSQSALLIGTVVLMALADAGRRTAWPALAPYAGVAVQTAGFAVILSAAGPWLAWTG